MVFLLKVIVWELWQRFFRSAFSFCRVFVKFFAINSNIIITDHASGICLPDWFKLVIHLKKTITLPFPDIQINTFKFCRVTLVSFSYRSKFHVNIITASGVVTVFVYIRYWAKIQKLEITPSEVFWISGDWSKLSIPNEVF